MKHTHFFSTTSTLVFPKHQHTSHCPCFIRSRTADLLSYGKVRISPQYFRLSFVIFIITSPPSFFSLFMLWLRLQKSCLLSLPSRIRLFLEAPGRQKCHKEIPLALCTFSFVNLFFSWFRCLLCWPFIIYVIFPKRLLITPSSQLSFLFFVYFR